MSSRFLLSDAGGQHRVTCSAFFPESQRVTVLFGVVCEARSPGQARAGAGPGAHCPQQCGSWCPRKAACGRHPDLGRGQATAGHHKEGTDTGAVPWSGAGNRPAMGSPAGRPPQPPSPAVRGRPHLLPRLLGGGGPHTASVTHQRAPGSCPTPTGGHSSVGTGGLPTAARHAPPLPPANDRQKGHCSSHSSGPGVATWGPGREAAAQNEELGTRRPSSCCWPRHRRGPGHWGARSLWPAAAQTLPTDPRRAGGHPTVPGLSRGPQPPRLLLLPESS